MSIPNNIVQEQHTKPPELPLLEEVGKAVVKTIDDMINGAIYAVGDKFGNVISALKEVKGPLVSLGSNSSLGGDPASFQPSITPSRTPGSSEKSESTEVAQAIVPEKVKLETKDIQTSKVEVAHVPDGTMVCPMCTPTVGVGMGQGRGGIGV